MLIWIYIFWSHNRALARCYDDAHQPTDAMQTIFQAYNTIAKGIFLTLTTFHVRIARDIPALPQTVCNYLRAEVFRAMVQII